jgi:hypothetical protein
MAGPDRRSDNPDKYAEADYLRRCGDEAMRDGNIAAAEDYYSEADREENLADHQFAMFG